MWFIVLAMKIKLTGSEETIAIFGERFVKLMNNPDNNSVGEMGKYSDEEVAKAKALVKRRSMRIAG